MRRLLGVIAVIVAALGFGVVASRPAPPPSDIAPGDVAAAARVIEALLRPDSGVDPISLLPPDYHTVMQAVPGHLRAPDGTLRAVHLDGGCSTPFGDDNTEWDYSVGCKAHDFGYDVLRYADRKGHPLPAYLRRDLDNQLSKDMHAQCVLNPRGSAGKCEAVADLYTVGLIVNSWHQRWGPPRAEPISSWLVGVLVVTFLLAARPPWVRRRVNPTEVAAPDRGPADRYMGLLRMLSMAGVVVGETVLALTHTSGFWLLQLGPLLFFAGGHANLLAWRESGGDYGTYLANRISALLRPVFAFVLAWLIVPLALEALDAPENTVTSVGGLVLQPLWLLGIFLITVAACPPMQWLYERFGAAVPVVFLVASTVVDMAGSTAAYVHVSGILLALGFAQLTFHWDSGALRQVPRSVLVAVAVVSLVGFVVLHYLPLLGIAQVCVASMVRSFEWVPKRSVRLLTSMPMTIYLVYVGIVLVYFGLTSAAGADWFTRPRTWLGVAMIMAATLAAYLWFERRPRPVAVLTGPVTGVHALASALGVGYGVLGVLGFAVTGVTWQIGAPWLFGVALDPLANLIHLMLGGYLLHCVHNGTSGRPWPWALTAVACVPPIFTTWSRFGLVVHSVTVIVALATAGALVVTRLRTRSTPVSTG
ncbi:phospholipase A2 [Actinocrispum wychmicini]|uniref:phospholipase A2 n=1 Tax=Actinocrispum wychmicini TaxID=1213861 RepID=UPI0014044922|nr:phospholipase A2 [Actinocrispum wychmicini]